MCKILITVLLLIISAFFVNCGLTVGDKKCGQKTCDYLEYCSEIERTCKSCSIACNNASHNYEPTSCMLSCQDYLHDLRYMRKQDGDSGNLKETVEKLTRIITATLTLVVFLLILVSFLICFQCYTWKLKKNASPLSLCSRLFSKKNNERTQIQSNKAMDLKMDQKADLRLEIPSSRTHTDNSPETVVTTISRRPAEDSTLDYAYDNPTLMTGH